MTELFRTELEDGIKLLNIELSEKQKEQLYEYYNMLVEKNKVMNLTAITEEKEFVKKHIIDSLAIINAGEEITNILTKGDIDLIDVGTGAGLPGIVLKIAFPKLRITLFDSLMKRLKFLDEVIDKLDLKDITTLHGRAEDIGRDKKYREKFDIVVSRAVANMSTLSEYCIPLVKPLGLFIPYKSGEIKDELKIAEKAIRILGGEVCSSELYELPESDIKRSLIVIEKIKRTPMEYPRKAGVPAKEPIGSK
ncbi:MAG: 16S rRNA (guanine(527)-N(7))-methyltransferase RsmG [Eubacteriales bacterium]|nr:16S rRNA (guanine(527)-N(7))-methyltransferase RsmG [Eubacteriales bacterium]